MKDFGDGLLRIYTREDEKGEGKPLYEALIEAARRFGMPGATVFRATMGYSGLTTLRTPGALGLGFDLPMIVEIVGPLAQLRRFTDEIAGDLAMPLATLTPLEILHPGSD